MNLKEYREKVRNGEIIPEITKDRVWEQSYQYFLEQKKYEIYGKYIENCCVLDVGCGPEYRNILIEKNEFHTYIGIDIDDYYYKTPAYFYKKDFFDYSSYLFIDTIVCKEVLEHIEPEKHKDFFKHCYDLLTTNGTLIISVPNAYSLNRVIGEANGMIVKANSVTEADKKAGHKVMGGEEYWLGTTSSVEGFKLEMFESIGFKPLPLSEMGILRDYWEKFSKLSGYYVGEEYCAEFLIILQKVNK